MYWIIGIVAVVAVRGLMLVGFVGKVYNGLVKLRNRYENAFAQIDVQLTRRYDLIPNLVETAKGYMSHEKETLEAVIQARNQALSAGKTASQNPGDPASMESLAQADGQLTGALGRLMMIAEAYPDLKANENMLLIQEELTSTENKLAFARQGFNDAVTAYNTELESFPTNVFGAAFGFNEANLFHITDEKQREAPKVSFE